MMSKLHQADRALGLASILLLAQAGFAAGQTQLFPVGENLVDRASALVGRVVAFNQVVVQADGTFAALPFSARGLLAGNGVNADDYDEASLIIYHGKRDCRGGDFIRSDKASVPYKAYPLPAEPLGGSTTFHKSVDYYAPVQSGFGESKYMFSYTNLVTQKCTEGTYFGVFLQAKHLRASAPPPLFLR